MFKVHQYELFDKICFITGDNHLLEIRLLKTGFLSRFQNKMSRFWRLAKEKNFSKEKINILVRLG
jgi:hypothetical protein